MTAPDPHESHGKVTLSLIEELPDGGRVFQSWTICDCTLPALLARLGPPEYRTVADAETVLRTAEAVAGVTGEKL